MLWFISEQEEVLPCTMDEGVLLDGAEGGDLVEQGVVEVAVGEAAGQGEVGRDLLCAQLEVPQGHLVVGVEPEGSLLRPRCGGGAVGGDGRVGRCGRGHVDPVVLELDLGVGHGGSVLGW